MFIIFLKFAENKAKAKELMEAHKQWIQQGFKDGVFLMVGSIKPESGGAILAHNTSLEALEKRLQEDPFVSEKVVSTEVTEVAPARVDERLKFLTSES